MELTLGSAEDSKPPRGVADGPGVDRLAVGVGVGSKTGAGVTSGVGSVVHPHATANWESVAT